MKPESIHSHNRNGFGLAIELNCVDVVLGLDDEEKWHIECNNRNNKEENIERSKVFRKWLFNVCVCRTPKNCMNLKSLTTFVQSSRIFISEIEPLLFARVYNEKQNTHYLLQWIGTLVRARSCVDHSKSNNNSILKQFRHNNYYCYRCSPCQTKRCFFFSVHTAFAFITAH